MQLHIFRLFVLTGNVWLTNLLIPTTSIMLVTISPQL